jgi:transcription-repair coupling factor (superfamily II helicase)
VSLARIASWLTRDQGIADALSRVSDGGSITLPAGAWAPAVGALVASRGPHAVVVVVCATGRESDQVRDELRSVVSPDTAVLDFPAWETLPHERLSPHAETVARRRSALGALHLAGTEGLASPLVVVASVRALVQPINPHIVEMPERIAMEGDSSLGLDGWVAYLNQCAYVRVDLVTRRGEYAVRGGILDVFPPLAEHPVRLDFFGAQIDTLHYFAVADQRSLPDPVESIAVGPVREMLITDAVKAAASQLKGEYKGFETMLDKISQGIPVEGMEALQPLLVPGLVPPSAFFPEDCLVVELSSQKVAARAEILQHTNREFLHAAWEAAALTGGQAPVDIDTGDFLSRDQLVAAVAPRPWISLDSLDTGDVATLRPGVAGLPLTQHGTDEVWEFVASRVEAGDTVVCVAAGHGLVERSAQILGDKGIAHRIDETMAEEPTPGVAIVAQGMVREGFWLPAGGLTVLTERELYGKAVTASRRSGRALVAKRTRVVDPLALSPGDFVVHDTHGVGKFVELVQREISTGGRDAKKSLREFVVLEYAPSKRGGAPDRLFVPTDQLDQLDHYVGSDNPTLSKMGGSDWAATKGRARKAVREIAVDLVKLYSARMAAPGFAFSPDTPWQRELEEAFPFVETPDQLTTIDEVKADMERPIPMDRLIAGDVGFGKTEIAVRAAFKAVQDGKQVALIAPTTLLVKQHLETFQERYAPFPVTLRALSRFQTDAEAKSVLAGLADGSVDVVIGTHRLLSKNVSFKDLGLIIIDEEQRFGVEHKDSLKALKTNVDVLAMSATPIPRTLEMAVTGIREMSTLATPPEERHPILTFVGPYNDAQVVAAIRRELLREGQVFFVHNRVQTIQAKASMIAELVPEARVAVAHGQMSETDLEAVMVDFWERRFDVLVSTTIIETGLDVTNANTLIVDRAERYGLSQLHQLRGRVGRGRERGYAYLLYDPELPMGELAHDRLATLAATTDLGGGTRIALKDLEMRGAGNLLGAEQAGHIQGVGFDLYLRMVGEAIALFRDDVAPGQTELRLEIPVDARIPTDYIDSERLRLEMYQKLSGAAAPGGTDDAITELVEEMTDRYGAPPQAVETLVQVTGLRKRAMASGLSELIVIGANLRVVGPPLPDSLQVRLARLYPKAKYIAPARVALIPLPEGYTDSALVTWVTGVLDALFPLTSGAPATAD